MTVQYYERDLLLEGIVEGAGSGKEGARILGISPALLSRIGSGERSLADDLKPKVAAMSMKAALAIIREVTGYIKLFSFFSKDRHPQNLISRVRREDAEADEAYSRIADRLTDKPSSADLTAEDVAYIQKEACQIADRINADYDFLTELDSRYPQLQLKGIFAGKEKIRP